MALEAGRSEELATMLARDAVLLTVELLSELFAPLRAVPLIAHERLPTVRIATR